MSEGHIERLLLADTDYQAALGFRDVAEEVVKLREQALELYTSVGSEPPAMVSKALAAAQREYKQLNRICLRHAARRLDASMRAEGKESEMESAVILFDITHPVAAAA
jgi:hypothetical protein